MILIYFNLWTITKNSLLFREKRLDVKSGYDHLEIITAQGPDHKEFIEPKVQGLWRIALDSNFAPEELESLKVKFF